MTDTPNSRYMHLTRTELEAERDAIECALQAKIAMDTLLAIDGALYEEPAQNAYLGERPPLCRNALRDNGQPYPRSGCAVCRNGGLMGCPYENRAQIMAGRE